MTPLRQRMIEDMQLRGLADRTQEAYVLAVRQLAEHYNKSPDQISEEELRHSNSKCRNWQRRRIAHTILETQERAQEWAKKCESANLLNS